MELDRRKDLETSGFALNVPPPVHMTNPFTELELQDVQGKLQRESANGTSLAQNVQQLESKLRSGDFKGGRSWRVHSLALVLKEKGCRRH
jgi:hypothetical protein